MAQSLESTGGTLVTPLSSSLPAVQLQAASPVTSASRASTTSLSPSPDLPGLSYSPSSTSSSQSSLCSSAPGDPVLHMTVSFEDTHNTADYYDSPVARINTQSLVPGYVTQIGCSGAPPASAFASMISGKTLGSATSDHSPSVPQQSSTYTPCRNSPSFSGYLVQGLGHQQPQ